ncbi:facilitated trehalose transporter Tret1-like [Chrysoperla carnea]|uniref:facilitated trehalose transporter Tret1-like n=1 Tax=Chrysoperla carnea TaxID=189513 RepID=UPI001D079D11|nr:facilitated trehalose transporter Tret1-like [Chrysoperla carnea]
MKKAQLGSPNDNNTSNNKKITTFRKVFPQLFAVSAKNLLMLTYGLTIGIPTIAIPALSGDTSKRSSDELILSKEQISWISSINYIMVPIGCALSGVCTQPLGRKKSMLLINIPFIVAWLVLHYGRQVEFLYLGFALTGFTGGFLEAPVLTYVAEITQPHLRGMLAATSSMSVIFGIFIQFLLGTFLNWRTICLINISSPIIAIISLTFIPESPHWLILKHRYDDAKASLCWLRGWCEVDQIMDEYNEIYMTVHKVEPNDKTPQNDATQKTVSRFNLSDYGKRTFLLPYFLVSFSFCLGHFSGMTTLQTYAVKIFDTLKAPIDKYYATLILGIVELVGSLLCVILVHYTGKRLITFVSTIGCSCCFLIVGTYAYFLKIDTELSETITQYNWIPTTLLITSAFLSHIGIRLLPWILIGEVFTNETRSNAAGLAGGAGYIFGFLSNKTFFSMINLLTWPGVFWFYGLFGLIGTILLYFILPETEGKPLGEIELHFAGVKKLRNSVRRKRKNETSITNLQGTKGITGIPDKVILESETVDSKL